MENIGKELQRACFEMSKEVDKVQHKHDVLETQLG